MQAELAAPDQKRIFYTAFYHMSLGPQLFDDVDGRYRGMDAAIHQVPAGQHNYTTFSLWDTFRAAHPAYTILQSDRVPDFANTLIRMAQQSESGMAVWPQCCSGARQTTGTSSTRPLSSWKPSC